VGAIARKLRDVLGEPRPFGAIFGTFGCAVLAQAIVCHGFLPSMLLSGLLAVALLLPVRYAAMRSRSLGLRRLDDGSLMMLPAHLRVSLRGKGGSDA